MRTKVTLVLILLNVALFYFIFFLRGGIEDLDPANANVLGTQASDVRAIAITSATGAAPVRLEKRGEAWFIVEPYEWPANPFAVRHIITDLQMLHPEATFPVEDLARTGQTLAHFGLEKPPLTLSFTPAPLPGAPAPAPVVLKIGDATQSNNNLYILSPDGARVHVVSRSLALSLSVDPAELRDERLFTIDSFEARALTLEPPPPAAKVRLGKDSDRWTFETMIKQARASRRDTDIAINGLRNLAVKRFVDAAAVDAARSGLATPALRITIEGNNRRQTLLLGHPVETAQSSAPAPTAPPPAAAPGEPSTDYYARFESEALTRSPLLVVALPNALLSNLRNAQTALRERKLLDFDLSNVSALTLGPSPELRLQRLESSAGPGIGEWKIVLPRRENQNVPSIDADLDEVNRVLTTLTQLSARQFVTDSPSAAEKETYGFNRPAREITLTFFPPPAGPRTAPAATTPPVTVQLGTGEGGQVYARLAHQDYVYLVSPEILRDTPLAARFYRDRLLRDLTAGEQIVALKLTELGATDKTLFETTLTPSAAAPTSAAGAAPTPAPTAKPADASASPPIATPPDAPASTVEILVKHLRTLRAKNFVTEDFPKRVFAGGEERTWKYQLDTTISLVGGTGAQRVERLFFLERTGGATQLVGSSDFNVVFEAEQPLLDAVFALTYGPRDPGPTPTAAPAKSAAPADPAAAAAK